MVVKEIVGRGIGYKKGDRTVKKEQFVNIFMFIKIESSTLISRNLVKRALLRTIFFIRVLLCLTYFLECTSILQEPRGAPLIGPLDWRLD